MVRYVCGKRKRTLIGMCVWCAAMMGMQNGCAEGWKEVGRVFRFIHIGVYMSGLCKSCGCGFGGGEVFYQNGKMLDGYFFQKIYYCLNYFSNPILLILNRSYPEHTRNYFRNENIIKIENRLHEITKILFPRKIKFRKI